MSVTFAQGFSAAGVAAGISAVEGKKDLALVVNNGPLDAAAGVFTSNRFCAAPVQWSRNIVSDGHVKAVILNSGGANACTGKPGYEQSKATAEKVAGLIGRQSRRRGRMFHWSHRRIAAARQRAVRRGQGI